MELEELAEAFAREESRACCEDCCDPVPAWDDACEF